MKAGTTCRRSRLANWYGEELVHYLTLTAVVNLTSQSWSTRAETVPTPVSNAPGLVVRAVIQLPTTTSSRYR